LLFEDFSIDPRCLRVLKGQRITEPTPVQAQAIPAALEGNDVIAVAQTGTGKTLAFGLPALTQLAEGKRGRTRMLVLTPTRELAVQVHSVLETMGRPLGLRAAAVYGGVGMEPQTRALRKGVDIVVACPGRLLDHMNRRNARLDGLQMLVLDEADHMLDMGFLPDIKRILSALPKERQTMMFSATFPKEIEHLAKDFQRDPVRVKIGRTASPVEAVRQGVYTVEQRGKQDLLTMLLKEQNVESALIFLRTKYRTDRLAKALDKAGLKAQAIHGGRTQGQRQRTLDGFRKGRFRILVATDVAARGLDIHGITHVINYDIPMSPDDYIHRIGRTARASAEGDAITFVCPEEGQALGAIERALGKDIPREEWSGSVPVRTGGRPASKGRFGKRSAPSRGTRGPGSRDGRPQRSRDGRGPSSRDGRPQASRDGRGPNSRDGRPQESRDGRGPNSRDGRPQRSRADDRGPNSRDGRPQASRVRSNGSEKRGTESRPQKVKRGYPKRKRETTGAAQQG
jgi:ATP-dependent RNA helicase RhlE